MMAHDHVCCLVFLFLSLRQEFLDLYSAFILDASGQLNNAFKRVFVFIIEQSDGRLDLRFFKGNLMKHVLFYYYRYVFSILSA